MNPDNDSARPAHPAKGAFHDYVRAVFAECSVRARLLRRARASWLHRLSLHPQTRIRVTNLYARE